MSDTAREENQGVAQRRDARDRRVGPAVGEREPGLQGVAAMEKGRARVWVSPGSGVSPGSSVESIRDAGRWRTVRELGSVRSESIAGRKGRGGEGWGLWSIRRHGNEVMLLWSIESKVMMARIER